MSLLFEMLLESQAEKLGMAMLTASENKNLDLNLINNYSKFGELLVLADENNNLKKALEDMEKLWDEDPRNQGTFKEFLKKSMETLLEKKKLDDDDININIHVDKDSHINDDEDDLEDMHDDEKDTKQILLDDGEEESIHVKALKKALGMNEKKVSEKKIVKKEPTSKPFRKDDYDLVSRQQIMPNQKLVNNTGDNPMMSEEQLIEQKLNNLWKEIFGEKK